MFVANPCLMVNPLILCVTLLIITSNASTFAQLETLVVAVSIHVGPPEKLLRNFLNI